MAEIIVSEILKFVLEKLTSEAVKKIVRSQEIQSELEKLERRLLQIKNVLNDASQKEVTDEAVRVWLNGLQHLAYDIDDVLDGLATDAMKREFKEQDSVAFTSKVRKLIIPTCCKNFTLSEKMSGKLDDITSKLEDLEKEKTRLNLVVINDMPKNKNRGLQTSLQDESSIVGRETEKGKLLEQLLKGEPCDQRFSVVPIVGMGGVGKTTLARLLYNDDQVNDHFDLKAWVCVSDDFDRFGISKVIFQSVAGQNKEFADLNLLQVHLKNLLTGKRFLLVLDDVWSESYDDWETLVTPFHACAPGSKIILTTRKEQLLKKIGYNHIDHLQSLSHDESLSLVALHALGVNNFDLHPKLKPYGEGIVEKCGDLPLALKAVGRLLRSKGNEEEYWKEVLNSDIWRLEDEGGIKALKLSYHDLSACLKRLFAYCSLFPKDYIFYKRKLVLLWMAEGFLHHSIPDKSEEDFGHECFDELLSRSFFQHAPSDRLLFVMHDLMNDLATSIAGEFFVRLDNKMEDMDKGSNGLEKYRHMSFVREEYGAYDEFKEFKRARNLRTLMATSVGVINDWQYFYLSNKILVDILPELPLLRVLNLSNFRISEVPESIGNLRHLRYLNLSRTEITQLPESVCNLYNLQTLILFGCFSLVKLPNNLSKLKNLRHFDMRNTPRLNNMPIEMGNLNSLQTLSKIILGGENGRFKTSELKELKNLCGEISIECLEKVQNATHVQEANFSHKRISELEVKWSDEFDGSRNQLLEKEALEGLKPHNDTLKKLKIVSYGGIELPNWVAHPSFGGLSRVSISGCKKCTCLPSLGQLHSLEELFIGGMDEVNNVGFEFLGTTGVGVSFPSLKTLRFRNMKGWESWSTKSGVVFPCLENLVIQECPNLVQVSNEAFPSLRHLEISKCDHIVLTSLIRAAPLVTELNIQSISGLTDEVWRGVVEHLRAVEELEIWSCDGIRYLWESEVKASTVLVSLSKLYVRNCDNLVSLGEREEEDYGDDDDDKSGSSLLLTSLRILEIWECKRMEHCRCPNNIETLSIRICDSLTDVSFLSSEGGHNLKSLTTCRCKGLINNNNKAMLLLQHVRIQQFRNLKLILEMKCFVHLTSLVIYDCESLESIPDQQLPDLTSLTELVIYKCPRIDGSFPRGLWPPKLQSLTIGMLKKPISEWGPQEFPPSLVDLTLYGNDDDDDDDVSINTQFSRLLPSSLTSLSISDFKRLETISISMGLQHLTSLQHLHISICRKIKDLLLPSSLTSLEIDGSNELETISKGLQHLTSLQHLTISFCPKLKDLPQMLPSLLSLEIIECPKLKERCSKSKSKSRRGSYNYNYWHLISHIPKIKIDYKLQ
ncbi:putative disease resistance RPP13-like protein 1 [Rutidosis leptorrhynchoides]|uniref:putative disease resistance RPP13-like protein 1 n=1 Tax=Rutidosis leptorrhynchoides TaxID=125765 RepID=UPI003A99E6AF